LAHQLQPKKINGDAGNHTLRRIDMLDSLRKFHQKHENWWMVVLAIVAVVGLLFFANVLNGQLS
jgi:hypothetical protein